MINILEEITRLRLKRNWSEYELAKKAGIPQSTISTWYRKGQKPSVESLEKICKGFGITLSEFFAEGNDPVSLTPEQEKMLDQWSVLSPEKKKFVKEMLEHLSS